MKFLTICECNKRWRFVRFVTYDISSKEEKKCSKKNCFYYNLCDKMFFQFLFFFLFFFFFLNFFFFFYFFFEIYSSFFLFVLVELLQHRGKEVVLRFLSDGQKWNYEIVAKKETNKERKKKDKGIKTNNKK